MSNIKDFIIKKGVLIKYQGSSGEVIIPEGAKEIGESAFQYDRNVTSIVMPESIIKIGESAFRFCSNLTNITISKNITEICESTFQYCSSLRSIMLPLGVTRIGLKAFSGCTSLIDVTIPKSITQIDSGAFKDCSSLESIIIPNGVTEIRQSVFENCSNLRSIALPEGVKQIGSAAFKGCSSLESITIPKSVRRIESGAFGGCSKCTTVIDSLTMIGSWLIYAKKDIQHAIIPANVTRIADGAFYDCGRLTDLTISEGVTAIGVQAFTQCSNLSSICIPSSVTQIGAWAFYGCPLKEIVIKGTPKIDVAAFSNKIAMKSIELPVPCVIEAPEKLEVLPYIYVVDWDDVSIHELHRILSASNLRTADLKYYAKHLLKQTKSLLPEFFKNISIPELLNILNSNAITPAKADLILELLKDNAECLTVYMEYYNNHFDIGTKIQAEIEKTDRAVRRALKENSELEAAVQELESMTPAQVKKLWKTEEGQDGLTIIKYGGDSIYVAMPGKIGKDSVSQIGISAMRASAGFSGRKSVYNKKMYKLRGIYVSDGIQEICINAFAGCVFLKDIFLPASVTKIDDNSFYSCHKLTIHAPSGSYAETYAKEHNIPFVAE